MKRKTQSLPKLKIQAFKQKTSNLFDQIKNYSQNQNLYLSRDDSQDPDEDFLPGLSKVKTQKLLQKSKTTLQKNKDIVEASKKFRIVRKKSIGPFLTGLQMYRQEEDLQLKQKLMEKIQTYNKNPQVNLAELFRNDNQDLQELRQMIKKTNKNLGSYKKQTLEVRKGVLEMADKYNDSFFPLPIRNKITASIHPVNQNF